MLLSLVPIVCALVLLPMAAFAQLSGRPYIGGAIGPNFPDTMLPAGQTAQVETGPGPFGDIALGWAFDGGLRGEIEGSYGSNTISTIKTRRANGELLPLSNVEGSLTLPAVMANIAYDIKPDRFGWQWRLPFQPYLGAGLGYSWLDFRGAVGNEIAVIHLPGNNTYVGPAATRYGSGGALAYQAFAGVSMPISQVHGLAATLEYRFFGTARADVPATATSTSGDIINGAVPTGKRRYGFAANDNILLVGLRYSFDLPH